MNRYDLLLGRKPCPAMTRGISKHLYPCHVGMDIGHHDRSCVAVVHFEDGNYVLDHMERTSDVYNTVKYLCALFDIRSGSADGGPGDEVVMMGLEKRLGKSFKLVHHSDWMRTFGRNEDEFRGHLVDRRGIPLELDDPETSADERDALKLALVEIVTRNSLMFDDARNRAS